MNTNIQKYLSFLVVIVIIAGGIFLFKSKKADAPIVEVPDSTIVEVPTDNTGDKPTTPSGAVIKPTPKPAVVLTEAQKTLLAQEKKVVEARDYETFANLLLEVYKNQWAGIEDFLRVESEFYVYTYNTYWLKGDLANALKFSTIVYDKVPEAWRFRYLRVLTLEKYGRDAFNKGDLVTAENYANQILRMMFRPEGANLLADVYISKIKTNMADGNTAMAKQNLGFIWDYELSTDRRATLADLKIQLGL